MLIGAFSTDTWCWRLPRPCGARNDGGERSWSYFAGVQWASKAVPRNGHNRSLHLQKIPRFRRNGGFSSKFVRPNTKSDGTPGTAFPTVRIPYAERKLATGREILLDCRQAQPTSHEFTRAGSALSAGIRTAYRRCPRYRRPGCPWPPAGRKDHCGAGAGRSSSSPHSHRN